MTIAPDPEALAEHARRVLTKRQAQARKIHARLRDLNATLSPKQRAYVRSQAPRRRLLGSRQSGKSHSIAVDHINTGYTTKNESLYLAPTSKSARNAVWSKMHTLNNEYELGLELQEGRFCALFPSGSRLDFEGTHDIARVQRQRGRTITGKLTIDEAGFFPEKLIRELLGPVAVAMFLTTAQRIAVASSPALQRRGMFFELGKSAAWEQHKLTAKDNPAIKDVQRALLELREASAWTETTPAYLREGLGEEVDDATHNVYELTDLNLIDALPVSDAWTSIMLIDFGKNDQSAVAVVGWLPHDPSLYVRHVEGHSDLDIEDLCQIVNPLRERYGPIGVYGDPGGGGAQHMDYMRKRHRIPIRPVAKGQHYKKPAIDAFNADARRGHYKVLRTSPLVDQAQALQWDPAALARGEYEEHPSMPNDLCDVACVYAHVQARHYRAEAAPAPAPPVGSTEHWKRWEDEGLARARAEADAHRESLEAIEEERAYLIGADPEQQLWP